MDDKIKAKYLKYRAEHPFLPAARALAWAKTPDASEGWDSENHDGLFSREVDGFNVFLHSEVESQYPRDNEFGRYIDGAGNEWSYPEWRGNHPKPSEGFPLRLPYTSFASGAYSPERHAYPYFIPDYVEDFYEERRKSGQSRSVAWMQTKEMVEEQIRDLFGGPLLYVDIVVKVEREGVELGSSCIGTTIIDNAEGWDYLFACAEEHGIIEDALKEARETINKLKEIEV